MGAGAPKEISSVSVDRMVTVIAAEANVEAAFKDLADSIRMLFEGNESSTVWRNIETARKSLEYRNRVLYGAVDALVRSQEK